MNIKSIVLNYVLYGFIVFTSCSGMTGKAVDVKETPDGLRHRSHGNSNVGGEHKTPESKAAFVIPGDTPSSKLYWVYRTILWWTEDSLDELKNLIAAGFHSNWFYDENQNWLYYDTKYKNFKEILEKHRRDSRINISFLTLFLPDCYKIPDPFTYAVILACIGSKDQKKLYLEKVKLLYKPDLILTRDLPINPTGPCCFVTRGGHVAYAASHNNSDLVHLLLELGLTWDQRDGVLSDDTELTIYAENAIKKTEGYQAAQMTSHFFTECTIQ